MAQNVLLGSIVPDLLRGPNNYGEWSHCMKTYLISQGLWDNIIIEAISTESPANQQASDHDEDRRRKNATALHAILVTCAPDICRGLKITDSAQIAWDFLAESCGESDYHSCGEYEPESPQIDHHSGKRNDNLETLLKHAYKKDWQSMESFLKDNPGAVNEKIPPWDETVLHVAVSTDNVEMVKKLVNLMRPEDLEITDVNDCTAFYYAAGSRHTQIAEYMFQKNPRLPEIPDSKEKWLPITNASFHHRREMSAYLLEITPSEVLCQQEGIYGSHFLEESIKSQMLDIASKALNDHRCLDSAKFHTSGFNALLWSLSGTPGIFPSSRTVRLGYWQRWIYSRIRMPSVTGNVDRYKSQPHSTLHKLVRNFLEFLGINQMYDLKKMHAYSSQLLDRAGEYVSKLDDSECEKKGIEEAFLIAVKLGIVEIVDKIIETQPHLLYANWVKENDRDLVMLSIVYRHEKIFSRWYGYIRTSRLDKSSNTLLHLAGNLSPSSVLTRIPGAALQMQRELQWYKEVERIVNPATKFKLNDNDKTPEQVFSESHVQLVKDGEKWMKDTATSYTVVAALIITVTFAAAFTVPGGNVQDIGIPVFLHKKAFETFILADAISLFGASTSVLMFLGILTSRYAEQDFLKSLPTKLIIGISMLFISITAMMAAFCAALMVTLRGKLEVIILIVVLACVPVILFMSLQFQLLVEMVKSTYGWGIFDRKKKI